MCQSECSKVFIALGGSQYLLLPASMFASKINPENRKTLKNPYFDQVFPDDKSAILCVNADSEKGQRQARG